LNRLPWVRGREFFGPFTVGSRARVFRIGSRISHGGFCNTNKMRELRLHGFRNKGSPAPALPTRGAAVLSRELTPLSREMLPC